MGYPVTGAVHDGADMRISRVEERASFYGSRFFFNLVTVLDGLAVRLTGTRVDVNHEVSHTKECFDNPRNRAFADRGRKQCA